MLVYHRVADLPADPFGQAVRPATFERQLRILQRYGTIVPAIRIVERIGRGESVSRLIGVTFDDGYVDNLTTAVPIASRLDVPITVFVTVRPVLDGTTFWWDRLGRTLLHGTAPASGTITIGDLTIPVRSQVERLAAVHALHARLRPVAAERREAVLRELESVCGVVPVPAADRAMTRDELRLLAACPGVEIGAHTLTHPSLATLPPDEQQAEIAGSRSLLDRFLGTTVRLLAYPFGKDDNVSALTRELAGAAGFDGAFTTIPVPTDSSVDVYAVPRLTVHEWPDDVFTAKIEALVGPPIA